MLICNTGPSLALSDLRAVGFADHPEDLSGLNLGRGTITRRAKDDFKFKIPPRPPFTHLIIIEPLGLLYASSGRFFSPENLVGRSGSNFPPSAATLSGLFAASKQHADIRDLMLPGPFWADVDEVGSDRQNFYVPTPRNYLVKDDKIVEQLNWHNDLKAWLNQQGNSPTGKFETHTWLAYILHLYYCM